MTKKDIYRILAKKYHPDVGGDEEIFKKINNAYDSGIKDLAILYRELENKEVELEVEQTDILDTIAVHNKEYSAPDFVKFKNGYRTCKNYDTSTALGMSKFWSDSLIDRIDRIKFIDNIIIRGIEIKVTIRWIKVINKKEYWQVSSIVGKFEDFNSYSDAILDVLNIKRIESKLQIGD